MAADRPRGAGCGVTEPGMPAASPSPGPPVVVVNPDGSPGVTVRTDVGVSAPALPWLATWLLVTGVTAGLNGAVLILIPVRLAKGTR
jgi:hypothetical protein